MDCLLIDMFCLINSPYTVVCVCFLPVVRFTRVVLPYIRIFCCNIKPRCVLNAQSFVYRQDQEKMDVLGADN